MKKILFILQILLKCSLIFLIAFIWLKFFISSIWFAGLIAFGITLFIELISIYFKKKSKNKTSLKLKEKTEAENMFLSLISDKDALNFFLELAKSRHANSEQKKDFVIINHNKSKVVLYPFLKIGKLTQDDILNIFKASVGKEVDKIVISCNEYDKECSSFIKNISTKIVLLDKYETYSLLYKEYDFYPEITHEYKKEAKLGIKELVAYSFNKSRTKGYLLSALILFIPSFFTKPNIYYCIVGSVLLLFALISFINPKFNSKKEQTIL